MAVNDISLLSESTKQIGRILEYWLQLTSSLSSGQSWIESQICEGKMHFPVGLQIRYEPVTFGQAAIIHRTVVKATWCHCILTVTQHMPHYVQFAIHSCICIANCEVQSPQQQHSTGHITACKQTEKITRNSQQLILRHQYVMHMLSCWHIKGDLLGKMCSKE